MLPMRAAPGLSMDDHHSHPSHDSPTGRAIQAAARQAQRARRAETVRLRQRAALLELLVQTMAELHISMAELNAARKALMPAWRHVGEEGASASREDRDLAR